MPLSEAEWGQILALAWRDQGFKLAFERNPVEALKSHDHGKTLLKTILVKNNNAFPLFELRMLDYGGYDFAGTTASDLEDIFLGKRSVTAEDSWFCDPLARKGDATRTAQDDTLSLADWGRIYARIWLDKRIDENGAGFSDQHIQKIYGEKKKYAEKFEADPAEVVKKITEELKNHKDKPPQISYTFNETRLYPLVSKPDSWPENAELENIINFGTTNGQNGGPSLRWKIRKCC
jgi:hypothetical protein